jgi:hypothetical protein|tara:strand:- start:136 stop:324 length:189 start_codon:yes stop_codon:yes gene_type:complete
MDDNVFTLVGRKLDVYEDELKTYLASGSADSMELYNRMVGRIEALRFIRDDLKEIETRYIER